MKRQKYRWLPAMLLVLVVLMVGCGSESEKTPIDEAKSNIEESMEGSAAETETVEEEIKEFFPYITEDGKLEIDSLFQFTGFNPDCGEEEGENIAALHVKNVSTEHLTNAEITVILADGVEFDFVVDELPAQQSVLVFSKDNSSYDGVALCERVTSQSEFENGDALMSDKLSISTEEMLVTLTNNTAETLTGLIVKCHGILDTEYFGGLTYSYPIDRIGAGESVTIEALECYLGGAAVVRVTQGN